MMWLDRYELIQLHCWKKLTLLFREPSDRYQLPTNMSEYSGFKKKKNLYSFSIIMYVGT